MRLSAHISGLSSGLPSAYPVKDFPNLTPLHLRVSPGRGPIRVRCVYLFRHPGYVYVAITLVNLWRLRPESNRRPRLCRPLHNHSATQPGQPLEVRGYGILIGAGNETRTRDPNLGKVVLYQLSYSRRPEARIVVLDFTVSRLASVRLPFATGTARTERAARRYRTIDQSVNRAEA